MVSDVMSLIPIHDLRQREAPLFCWSDSFLIIIVNGRFIVFLIFCPASSVQQVSVLFIQTNEIDQPGLRQREFSIVLLER